MEENRNSERNQKREFQEILARIKTLEARIEFIYSYFRLPYPDAMIHRAAPPQQALGQEELLRWAGRASLLPRVATVSFALVAALVLRVITENRLLDVQLGSAMGLVYAGTLLAVGSVAYTRARPVFPTLAVCGVLLMYSVILETHERFGTISSSLAYLLVLFGGTVSGIAGLLYRAWTLFHVGVLGMGVMGVLLNLPRPVYPVASAMAFLGTIMVSLATSRGLKARIPSWFVFSLSLWIMVLWSWEIRVEVPNMSPYQNFLPLFLVAFVFLNAGASLLEALRTKDGRISILSAFRLVASGMVGLWGAARMAQAQGEGTLGTALGGVTLGVAYLALAHYLSARRTVGSPGTTAFSTAGSSLIAFVTLGIAPEPSVRVFVFSALGLALGLASRIWRCNAVRVLSCVLLLCASVVAGVEFWWPAEGGGSVAALSSIGALMGISFILYRCWKERETGSSAQASSLVGYLRSRLALCTLAAGLFALYLALRNVSLQALLPVKVQQGAFGCTQTIILNAMGAGVFTWAYKSRDKEVRVFALILTATAALKVVMDFFEARGVPLVLSVLSFGLLALLASWVLRKWETERSGGKRPGP